MVKVDTAEAGILLDLIDDHPHATPIQEPITKVDMSIRKEGALALRKPVWQHRLLLARPSSGSLP